MSASRRSDVYQGDNSWNSKQTEMPEIRWAVGPLGRWAVGPLGRWAVGPLGRWAVGPLGRWAVGPLGRWAVGPLGRWAVGPLMVGALCAVSGMAQAQTVHPEYNIAVKIDGSDRDEPNGYWTMTQSWLSGTASGTVGGQASDDWTYRASDFEYDLAAKAFIKQADTMVLEDPNFRWKNEGRASINLPGNVDVSSYHAVAVATLKGTKQIEIKWEPRPDDKSLLPTKDLDVLVTGTTGGIIPEGGKGRSWVGVEPAETEPFIETPGFMKTEASKLFHIDHTKINGNNLSVVFSLPLGATAMSSPTVTDRRSPFASVSTTTKIDTRSVVISSSIDPSYRRTMDTAQPLLKYRDQTRPQPFQAPMVAEVAAGLLNEPKPDGSMMGDTVANWRSGTWQAQGVGFTANIAGNWNAPTFDWSVSGENTPSYLYGVPKDEHSSSLTLGLNLGTDGQGFPKSSVITVDVTDSDQAVGKNTYAMTWHLPYEKTQDLPNGRQRKEVLWISDNPITPLGGGISATKIPPKPFDSLAAIDDVKVVAGAFGVPTGALTELQEVFKAITNISEWGNSGMEINVTENQIVHTDVAFEGALYQNPDNIEGMTVATRDSLMAAKDYSSWKKYNCYGGYVRLHHEKNWLADYYDAHGFNSSNHLLHHDVIEQYRFENFYQKQITTPVSPTLGDREVPPSYNLS